MSQYPSPYPPSPYLQPPIDFSSYPPSGDLLGPARRAGVLMIVLGTLGVLMGACDLGRALLISADEIAQQQAVFNSMGLPQSPISPETARALGGVLAGLTLLTGLAFVIDGVYVRRGSPTATTLGLVLAGGLGLLAGLIILLFVVAAFAVPPLAAIACVMAVPLGLLIWAFVWLFVASRQGPHLAAARQQYAAQYYHLQQQQQSYAQAGGYGMSSAPQGYGYPGQQSQGANPPAAPGASAPASAPQDVTDPNRPPQSDSGGSPHA